MRLKPTLLFIYLFFTLASSLHAAFPDPKDLPIQTNLPDVLTLTDSSRVITPTLWPTRREQMKAILEYYELGHAPPPPGNVTGKILQSQNLLDGAVKYRLVHLSFGPDHRLGFDIAVFTPAGHGPFPTIIHPAFFATPGTTATNSPAEVMTNYTGFANALTRGYAIVTWRYTECGDDNTNFLASSYYPAYPGYDWGALMGWSWGLSRVVDYVETQRFADKKKIIALGHSRLGKMVMVAAAFDDRISLAVPAGSGCAGTGAFRFCGKGRGGKQGIEGVIHSAPWWFTPQFEQFSNRVYQLPFDEHWFVALTAPRPWISIEATHDQYCVPNAVKQTVLAAKPVYEFLGAGPTPAQPGAPDRVGVDFENHQHALTTNDWNAALDFADQQLRGIDHHRTFNQFSPAFPDPQDLPVQTNLPDVMAMADGAKVTTAAQWLTRREEIKAVLEHYELGHAPPPPGNVKGKVIQSENFLDGTVQYRIVHISFGPHHQLGFNVAVFTPAGRGPFPTIINPTSLNIPGMNFTNKPATAATTKRPAHPIALADPAKLALGFTNILYRGYAIVTYNHNETGVDNTTWRSTAYYPAYPGYDWGEMMGWAWGFSRIVDYLETQSFVDKTKIIGVGHSRRGKIVMTAAAFDDRIALVAPGGSGCMGSSAYRFCGPGRGGKEGIEAMVQAHYFWYTPLFEQFTNRVYQVPFDAHWVVALIAPRPYLAVDATQDIFCVPNAVKQTVLAAKPVYQFLGVNPDRLGVHFENHPHELAPTDWTAILDFADQQLRGIDHHRTFDQFPSDEVSTNSVAK